MIRYGIVGVGGYAAVWLQALESLQDAGVVRLAAAVVRNPARHPEAVARLQQRGCALYASLEEMLDRAQGQVDVVGLPTGIAQHVPMAIQAMEAGFSVLVEKPVAATIQEVHRLRQAESRTGRWCAVGYQFIYSRTIQWLRQKLASGQLGTLRQARAVIGWPRGDRYYARNSWAGQLQENGRWVLDGPATNATAHHLTNMLYLAASQGGAAARVSTVRAELYRARAIPSYDTSCVEVVLESGTRILHCASHALVEEIEPVMDLICDHALVHWQSQGNRATIRHHDGRLEEGPGDDRASLHAQPFLQVARVASGQDPAPLCGLAEAEPQVLVVNLAFESSAGIATIPAAHTRQGVAADGSPLVAVAGMADLLRQALASGRTFSELGAPWARTTPSAPAEGYRRFPRNPALLCELGCEGGIDPHG